MVVAKQAAFFEGKFSFEAKEGFRQEDQELLLLSATTMLLLERIRG